MYFFSIDSIYWQTPHRCGYNWTPHRSKMKSTSKYSVVWRLGSGQSTCFDSNAAAVVVGIRRAPRTSSAHNWWFRVYWPETRTSIGYRSITTPHPRNAVYKQTLSAADWTAIKRYEIFPARFYQIFECNTAWNSWPRPRPETNWQRNVRHQIPNRAASCTRKA